MDNKDACWFETWFNSPYYHLLYKNRNDSEAALFIDSLLNYLHPAPESRFWDMACGRGRHSVYISKKGYDVTGTDLSQESIRFASQFETGKLRFYRHDMRQPFVSNYFDYVLNLFTSFGYFEHTREEIKVFSAVHTALKPGGTFVLDYLNTAKIVSQLLPYQEKEVEGIVFRISKEVKNGFIVKRIQFSDRGKDYDYYEKVKLFSREQFMELAAAVNFTPGDVFGDYSLSNFDPDSSDRLICIFKK